MTEKFIRYTTKTHDLHHELHPKHTSIDKGGSRALSTATQMLGTADCSWQHMYVPARIIAGHCGIPHHLHPDILNLNFRRPVITSQNGQNGETSNFSRLTIARESDRLTPYLPSSLNLVDASTVSTVNTEGVEPIHFRSFASQQYAMPRGLEFPSLLVFPNPAAGFAFAPQRLTDEVDYLPSPVGKVTSFRKRTLSL